MMKTVEMFKEFRKEIDEMCAEDIVKNLDTRPVMFKGKQIGFLMLDGDYVDGFYIMPEYRREGHGKRFIIDQYKKDGCRWEDLRIVKHNVFAWQFWNSVFDLEWIDGNFCDNHYLIRGLKNVKNV